MTEQKNIYKPSAISGYTEWLPEERLVELQWIDHVRRVFESYGFCSIETPAVEEIDVLVAKGGDSDKEIYALRRLQETEQTGEPRVALHYDLTVPLARYVAQHYNDLVMPFKRYQIQQAWRGERPQEGRYRQFCQCDIDIIDNESVSIHYDAELPAIVHEVLSGLSIGPYTIHINNRKILQGFYEGLGIKDVVATIRIVDKLDKIGRDGVFKILVDQGGLDSTLAEKCVDLAEIKTNDLSFADQIREMNVQSELLDAGIDELTFVMSHLRDVPENIMLADLSIARGFDYYTGTVYEGKMTNFPAYPSICSGGRYENLVGSYLRKNLPGVGMSIGLTRIFAKLLKEGLLDIGPKCPTEVMVAYIPGGDRDAIVDAAKALRSRGLKVEMFHEPRKMQQQIRYASRKGIPFVWFPGTDGSPDEVKNMKTGEQVAAAPDWKPPTTA